MWVIICHIMHKTLFYSALYRITPIKSNIESMCDIRFVDFTLILLTWNILLRTATLYCLRILRSRYLCWSNTNWNNRYKLPRNKHSIECTRNNVKCIIQIWTKYLNISGYTSYVSTWARLDSLRCKYIIGKPTFTVTHNFNRLKQGFSQGVASAFVIVIRIHHYFNRESGYSRGMCKQIR